MQIKKLKMTFSTTLLVLGFIFGTIGCSGTTETPGPDAGDAGLDTTPEIDQGSEIGLGDAWRSSLVLQYSKGNQGLSEPISVFNGALAVGEDGPIFWFLPTFRNCDAAFWSTEKNHRAISRLAPGECSSDYTAEEMKFEESCHSPQGNAGKITLSGTWEGMAQEPVSIEYVEITNNYPLIMSGTAINGYGTGHTASVVAEGGDDIGAFDVETKTIVMELIEPKFTSSGGFARPSMNSPMTIKWKISQGETETPIPDMVGFVLNSLWVADKNASGNWNVYPDGHPKYVEKWVVCRANTPSSSSGEFTVPADMMSYLSRHQVFSMLAVAYKEASFSASNLAQGRFAVHASSSLTLDVDETIEPGPEDMPSTLPKATMQEGYVGKACTSDSDCGGGFCPSMLVPPDGFEYFLEGYCTVGCTQDSDCPSDAACHMPEKCEPAMYSFCAKKCTNDNDCREPFYWCSDRESLCVSTMMIPCI